MTTSDYARQQYELIRSSREVLLDFSETMSPSDFIRTGDSFGKGGSVRHLLVHIINCYEHWIARQALQLDREFADADSIESVEACRKVFLEIDDFMDQFLHIWKKQPEGLFSMVINKESRQVEGLKLFTHTITHEFHHKGQILTLSRMLGYIPVDTDVIR